MIHNAYFDGQKYMTLNRVSRSFYVILLRWKTPIMFFVIMFFESCQQQLISHWHHVCLVNEFEICQQMINHYLVKGLKITKQLVKGLKVMKLKNYEVLFTKACFSVKFRICQHFS